MCLWFSRSWPGVVLHKLFVREAFQIFLIDLYTLIASLSMLLPMNLYLRAKELGEQKKNVSTCLVL